LQRQPSNRPQQEQKPTFFKQHLRPWQQSPQGEQHWPQPEPQAGSQQLPQAGSQHWPQPQLSPQESRQQPGLQQLPQPSVQGQIGGPHSFPQHCHFWPAYWRPSQHPLPQPQAGSQQLPQHGSQDCPQSQPQPGSHAHPVSQPQPHSACRPQPQLWPPSQSKPKRPRIPA
jgi:hypothetical protein